MDFILWGEAMEMRKNGIICLVLCLITVLLSFSGCTGTAVSAGAGERTAMGDEILIDEENMLRTVEELSSEKYEGRLAGTEGNEAAARYIADAFKAIGLSDPTGLDNYIQRYPQTVITLKSVPRLSIVDEAGKTVREFKYVENFTLRSLSSKTNNIDISSPLYLVSELSQLSPENRELKDKLLLVSWRLRGATSFYRLVELVNECGAAGALGEYDIVSQYRTTGSLTVTPMLGPWLEGEHSPFVNVDNDTYKALMAAFEKGQRVSYKCSFTREDGKQVPNVVGLLEGSDEKLKDQYIIIGAHFDHVGRNLDGSFNPGGLDNASGVASMLEVARVLKETKTAPGKSILFIAFNGEEGGLQGSEYYAGHPVYPLKDAKMICLDMVGSSEKLPLMVVRSEGGDNGIQNELYDYCRELGIKAEKAVVDGSDHTSFAGRGVDSVLLINEDYYNGYHSPADTAEDVDKTRIEQVTKLVLHYLDKTAF